MALRSIGCLSAALLVCALMACGKDKDAKGTNIDFTKRCEQLAKVCGDKEKHIGKMTEECKASSTTQIEKGCADKATVLYDCYEREVCNEGDRVWTMNDMAVLAQRKAKCKAEQTALKDCLDGKPAEKTADDKATDKPGEKK